MSTICIRIVRILIITLYSILSFTASAQVVIRHIGANDPETEGFIPFGSGMVETGPVFDDFGRDSWSIKSIDGSGSYYSHPVDAEDRQAAINYGWIVSGDMRITDPNGRGMLQFGANENAYRITAWLVDGNDIIINNGGHTVYRIENGGTNYHRYTFVYDALDQAASLWIDGIFRANVVSHNALPQGGLYFGVDGVGVSGHTHWSEVSLTIIPEPSTVALLTGFGALFFTGAVRWRKRKSSSLRGHSINAILVEGGHTGAEEACSIMLR
jgi:hypothetical protein